MNAWLWSQEGHRPRPTLRRGTAAVVGNHLTGYSDPSSASGRGTTAMPFRAYTIPRASMASATRVKAATLAPTR
jgi:hypothetical protein